MENNRLTSFGYKGSFLFQELFQNELEVLESELLEAEIQELNLRGETAQLLIIPNLTTRTSPYPTRGVFESIKNRIILSIEYIRNKDIYNNRFQNEKAIRELGDPTVFTGDNLAELINMKDNYNSFLKGRYTFPGLLNFNFLRVLNDYYGNAIETIFKDAELQRYRIENVRPMLYPKEFRFTIFNPNPGYPVVHLNNLRMVFSNEHYIITNYRHYMVDQKKELWYSDMDLMIQYTAVNLDLTEQALNTFKTTGVENYRVLWTDFHNRNNLRPTFEKKVVEQTAVDPNPRSNTLLFKLLFNLFCSSILNMNPSKDFGAARIQFVNASWNIQEYVVKYMLANLINTYMEQAELFTIKSNQYGDFEILRPRLSTIASILPTIINAFNDALDILEEPEFID